MWLHRVNSKLQVSTDYQYQQSWAKIRRVTYTWQKRQSSIPIYNSVECYAIENCKLQVANTFTYKNNRQKENLNLTCLKFCLCPQMGKWFLIRSTKKLPF